MSDPKPGIAPKALAEISQMAAGELSALLNTKLADYSDFTVGQIVLAGPDANGLHPYSDALAIEVARQLSDYAGLPLTDAMRAVTYTGAIENYAARPADAVAADFWVAIVGARNTWGSEQRGSVPVTTFGPGEFWSTAHFHGTFEQMTNAIKDFIARDGIDYPESDFARVFMTNVSAADRRLSKRI